MNSKIVLPQKVIDQFKLQALGEYPHECCGFLIGTFSDACSEALEYVPAENSMKERRERRFILSPEEYLKAENRADSQKMSIIGIVHSHPDAPAKPSEFDRDHAFPGFSYVIVSVTDGSVNGFSSWRITEDRKRFVEESIDIKP